MLTRLFPLILVITIGGISVFGQDEYALSRLPVLSKTIDVADGVSPDPLPSGAQTIEVDCLGSKRTINAAIPWTLCYDSNRTTDFVRPHLRLRGFPGDNSWHLLIKTEAGREIQKLDSSSFRWTSEGPEEPSIADRWTEPVPGQKFQIELHAGTTTPKLRVSVEEVNISFFRPGVKAITTGHNDMRDLLAVVGVGREHRRYNFSRSIAIIHLIMSDGSGRETNCTGFLLTQDVIMTNQHCISADWQLETAKAVFGFESLPPVPTESDQIPFTRILMQDQTLDFAVLELKWAARVVWQPARIDTQPLTKNQQLILIQHPSNQPKAFSLIGCTVDSVVVADLPKYSNDFYHLCDCEGGSSGAPVIDDTTGRVVGLQHREIRKAGDEGINLAVRMAPIVAKIRTDQTLFNRISASIQGP